MNSTLEAVDLGVSQVRGREEVTNDRKNSEEEAPDESVTMTSVGQASQDETPGLSKGWTD